jgi:hypothetical protein
MTAPTVPVTVRLADFGGVSEAGITVTARLNEVDYAVDGTIVSTEPVTAVSDVNGIAVLNLFPNALIPSGLGTRGTIARVTATLPDSRQLYIEAAIPNEACSLTSCVVNEENTGLDASQMAASDAQAARDLAKKWATQTASEVEAGQGYGAKKYSQDAATSAAAALASEQNADTSEAAAAASAGAADTSADAALVSQLAAAASQTAAATSATSAASSASMSLVQAGVAVDEPTGRLTVADGQAFKVQGAGEVAAYEYRRINAGTPSSLIATYPSWAAVDGAFHERFFASQARSFEEKRTRVFNFRKKQLLVLIGLGQSNNAAYNAPVSGTVSSTAYQFVGGNAVGEHEFYPVAQNHSVNWSDVASLVPFTTAAVEHPISGALTMLEGLFPRIHAHSAAYGGNAILMLSGAARLANLCAYVHRMCDEARAAGYEPVVAFTFVQGEANMSSYGLITEEQYYGYGSTYLRMAQRIAAQAMDRPDYRAPIVVHNPGQMLNGADSRAIQNALIRIVAETPNAILGGCLNQWSLGPDQIHGDGPGFRQRGEQDGWALAEFFTKGRVFKGLRLVDAFRVGATVTGTLNDEAERDATATFGSLLNVGNAFAGVEFTYDGAAYVPITNVVVTGRRVVCTLGSDPGVHAATEELRIAMQTTLSATSWPTRSAGSQIRSTKDRFISPYDGSTQYVWASPCKLAVR